MNKLKSISRDVLFISRLTKVTKKKLRLILSIFLSNITVFADILIILVFANLLSGDGNNDSSYYIFIKIIVDNLFLLPLLVVFRTLIGLIEKVNIQSLQLQVQKICNSI